MSQARERPLYQVPSVFISPGGFHWKLCHDRWREPAVRLERFLAGDDKTNGIEVLKSSHGRVVARLHFGDDMRLSSAVAKAFPMTTLKQRLFKHRRYALAEYRNLMQARASGLPVPEVFGFGVQKRFGLVYNSAVMMEDLHPRRTLSAILADSQGRQDVKDACMNASKIILLALYGAACHHIDVNGTAILSAADFSSPPRVIDFQYVRFLKQPSFRSLACMAGYLGWAFTIHCNFDRDYLDKWAEDLMKSAAVSDEKDWWETYSFAVVSDLSRHRRMALH